MRAEARWIVYLAAFALSGLACGFAYRFVDWSSDVRGCALNRTPGAFLGYCTTDEYGDYEHGAYYLDLEPQAVEAARRAEVLIFGNSRAQFAFSTEAVAGYFAGRSIPFYLLGFGYADGTEFAAALVEKYRLHPRFVIVDTNPFFTDLVSAPAKAMMLGGSSWWGRPIDWISSWWDYLEKKAFNSLQPIVCGLRPSFCTETFRTIYRSAETGFWVFNTFVRDYPGYPVTTKKLVPLSGGTLTVQTASAKRFLDLLGVPRECVVLTAAPSTAFDAPTYAVGFGNLLGLRALLPQLDGLRTIDASHLTRSSAERWSAAIMHEIDLLLTQCLAPPAH